MRRMTRWFAFALVFLVTVAVAQDGSTPETAVPVDREVVAYTLPGGIDVIEEAPGPSPNLGVEYEWNAAQWSEHIGDVKTRETLRQPDGAKSLMHVHRVNKIYREPVDLSTGVQRVTPAYASGWWVPEQFVGVERETAEDLRGLTCTRLVRADQTWITVVGSEDQVAARWAECLGRGVMPSTFGPKIEKE